MQSRKRSSSRAAFRTRTPANCFRSSTNSIRSSTLSANPILTIQIAVTGLSAIAARSSADMIGKLSRGLTVEFLFVAAFIGLAFRSAAVAFAAILPGIFPIVSAGVLLSAMGEGLQFASVVALIVSFGLGLSATIHFLNRMRRERRPGDDPAIAVERATLLIGPALIVTSIVLACGLAVTAFSDLPTLRLFGRLSAFSMLMALTADLLILRPVITLLSRLANASTRAASHPPPMTRRTAHDDGPDGSVRTEG